MLGAISQMQLKGVPDRLLNREAKVFRVHGRYAKLLLTYWCSQPTIIVKFEAAVCNNWTSCLNYGNSYFQCSIVSLILCKGYLNMVAFRTKFLLLIKSWTFWYIERLPMSLNKRVIHFWTWSIFSWPNLYIPYIHWGVPKNSPFEKFSSHPLKRFPMGSYYT